MVERLKFYIESQGMIASQFADAIGMPRSSFSQLLTGRNKSISDATIGKIHAAFPKLSISWLLFGEGEMLTDANTSQHTTPTPQPQLSIFDENAIFAADAEDDAKYDEENAPIDITQLGGIGEHPTQVSDYNLPIYRINTTKNEEKHHKKITKIMVFYNDNTYATFLPE